MRLISSTFRDSIATSEARFDDEEPALEPTEDNDAGDTTDMSPASETMASSSAADREGRELKELEELEDPDCAADEGLRDATEIDSG